MTFTRIALQKLNDLLKRKGVIRIIDVDDREITIEYADRVCTVSAFGNVKWLERPQK